MAKSILASRSNKIDTMLDNPDELLRLYPMWQLKRVTGNRFLPRPGGIRDQDDDEIYGMAALDAIYEQVDRALKEGI